MTTPVDPASLQRSLTRLLAGRDLASARDLLGDVPVEDVVDVLERLDPRRRAVAYRLLGKDEALEVFEAFAPAMQSQLLGSLQDVEVAAIFAELEPDDRVWLLDELPASLSHRLLQGLDAEQRGFTAELLGYPRQSVGHRMSPEVVALRASETVARAIERVMAGIDDAETVYTLPVVDGSRRLVGVTGLRELLRADRSTPVADVMREAVAVTAYTDAEQAARTCTEQRLLALPVVDNEQRLLGVLTVDDAVRILEQEESEDAARAGGVEPLRLPYLSTPLTDLVRSRVVWLLVLAIGAALTVSVLEVFEATLAQVTMLALFVPLLIGTGGNTGNQAATTVTRALALEDVRPGDVGVVLWRELRVGALLGATLGAAGGLVTGLLYEPRFGLVIGLTLVTVCTLAASIGGVMPMVARALKVDPAVFSNPFITTFVDAAGLVVYFLIAQAVLGL